MQNQALPDYPLKFIQKCVSQGKILWTYHVNMRLKHRFIARQAIVDFSDCYEIIEHYPKDKYFPSYLVRSKYQNNVIHILFAIDLESNNIRIITAYRPNSTEWEAGFRIRRRLS